MKVIINIPEKIVKQAMLAVTLKVDEACDCIDDVLATESVEVYDVIEAISGISGKEELNAAMIGIAALGIMQIIKNKVEPNEQV